MKHRASQFGLLYTALLSIAVWCQATLAQDSDEYSVKAEYLYNLTKFVTWPHSEPSSSINICVYGQNPFGTRLDQLTTKTAKGLPIVIKYQSTDPAGDLCHIVFFSHNDITPLDSFHSNGNQPQLLVGEDDSFLDRGGLISLVSMQKNVRLHINLTAAKRLGFKISGNLLEISASVK
jgi:hypothetical protein